MTGYKNDFFSFFMKEFCDWPSTRIIYLVIEVLRVLRMFCIFFFFCVSVLVCMCVKERGRR